MTDGDECFHALVTYTKEGHKKKGKKWLDGRIQVKKSNRNAVLRDENGTTVVATGRVPCEVELSDDSDEFQLLECSVSYTLLIVITECVSLLANIEAGCSKVVGLKSAKQGNDARACDTDKENENNDEDDFMPASQPACAPPPPKRQRHAFCLPTTALPAPNHRIFRTDAQILSILKSIQELKPTTTEYKPVRPTIERIPAVQPSDDLQGMSKAMSTSFGSSASYRDSWLSCLEGEIITKLGESLSSFYDAVRRANLPPSPSPHAIQSAMEGSRIPYFGSCRMSTWKPASSSFAKFKRNGMKQKLKQKKRKNNECSESEDEPDDHDLCGNSAKPRSFLILTTGKGRLKSSDFSKGDIWVISTDALLGNNHSSSRSQQNVWIVRSLWHGPNIDGK